jgi:hypothetical protein
MVGVMLNRCVTEVGSTSFSCGNGKDEIERILHHLGRVRRTGTFFCVITQQLSAPLMPSDVRFSVLMALKAYSVEEQ